jgi:hypothetical protein
VIPIVNGTELHVPDLSRAVDVSIPVPLAALLKERARRFAAPYHDKVLKDCAPSVFHGSGRLIRIRTM